MVDEKFMPFNVGVELSFVGSKAQAFIADILEYDQMMISLEKNILQYFPSDYSKEQIEAIIMKLIRKWYNRHNK